jgi:hypothetical protein
MRRLQALGLPGLTNPRLKLFVELGVIYASLKLALPAALAVYPQVLLHCTLHSTATLHFMRCCSEQRAGFPVESLEPVFNSLVTASSAGEEPRRVRTLYANKGL